MTVLDDAARLVHLGLALRLREATIQPVLAAVAATGSPPLLVGASAHGRRLEIVMPYEPAAFAILAPGATPPADPSGVRLRVRIDGEAITVGLATASASTPRAAVDELAPPAVHAAWFDLVDQLCSIANARITGRTRFVDGARVVLDIHYPDRDRETDAMLVMGIDQLAGDLGISAAQRRLWPRVHPELGGTRELSISTAATATGVSSQLGITYPVTRWELAVRLAQGLVLGAAEAAAVPTALGQLAGALGSDVLQAVELVLGPHEPPDVIVWAYVGRAG